MMFFLKYLLLSVLLLAILIYQKDFDATLSSMKMVRLIGYMVVFYYFLFLHKYFICFAFLIVLFFGAGGFDYESYLLKKEMNLASSLLNISCICFSFFLYWCFFNYESYKFIPIAKKTNNINDS